MNHWCNHAETNWQKSTFDHEQHWAGMSKIIAMAGCRSDAGTYQYGSMRVKELVHQEQITVKSSTYAADLIKAIDVFAVIN